MGPVSHCGRLRVVVFSGVVPPAPLRRLDRAAPVPGSPAAARSALLAVSLRKTLRLAAAAVAARRLTGRLVLLKELLFQRLALYPLAAPGGKLLKMFHTK